MFADNIISQAKLGAIWKCLLASSQTNLVLIRNSC